MLTTTQFERDTAATSFGQKPIGLICPENADKMREGICVSCGEPATEFRVEWNRREWAISGLCQVCQDSIFGED